MYLKSFAIAAITSAASLAANAALTSPAQVAGPSFSDIELSSIALLVTSNVVGAMGYAPYALISPGFQFNLPPVSVSAAVAQRIVNGVVTNGSPLTENFSFSSLSSGTYSLQSSGTFNGSNFVASDFKLVITMVPEPESAALLLAGLGLVGAITRRGKKRSSEIRTAPGNVPNGDQSCQQHA